MDGMSSMTQQFILIITISLFIELIHNVPRTGKQTDEDFYENVSVTCTHSRKMDNSLGEDKMCELASNTVL